MKKRRQEKHTTIDDDLAFGPAIELLPEEQLAKVTGGMYPAEGGSPEYYAHCGTGRIAAPEYRTTIPSVFYS